MAPEIILISGPGQSGAITLCTSVNGGAHKFNYYVNIMIISQLLLSLERNFNYMHAGRSIRDIYHGPSSG